MTQITKNLDRVQVWDDWYVDSLDYLAEEAKAKGIEIEQEYNRRRLALSFSGFWSQGDGLAFDSHINWPVFFEAHPNLKETYLNEWLLLSANPKYVIGETERRGRRDNTMRVSVDLDMPDEIESGFFAGVAEDHCPAFDWLGLEDEVLSLCRDEADRMYNALEEEYEHQLEYEKECAKEDLIEEYQEPIRRILWPLSTTSGFERGDVEHEEIDFADLCKLDLINCYGGAWRVSKKGLKVLA